MIKTLNPRQNPAKTIEILSRYRPIAPKPETDLSPKIKQSSYLRSLWAQLQARPTRTRKRGRPLPSFKRQKTHILGFCPATCHLTPPPPPPPPPLLPPRLVTLSLLPCSSNSPSPSPPILNELNTAGFNVAQKKNIPEEKDLLKQLQGGVVNASSVNCVIAPQAVRAVGSCISVGSISVSENGILVTKTAEQVEEEVESEALPAVITDSKNRVRMANSAYREMVGEPVCSWLQSVVTGATCTSRICGDVALHLCGSSKVPISSNGFSCWVRIGWNNQGKKIEVNSFCDVNRLSCQSRDYLFSWRFHTINM
ncbi:LOW QUALITY PROTEIN: uncharacterized protein LOC107608516 [Arachis ipaensis]|uniref:LOW QUALITY PROTEIN: uncharacterized protein LOC107608516 n=1 Tax=Arachis ipaensis TaxID=130454 RepID=UPI0007AF9B08|nr:LOW QUALITY PROTEIN: uncharacterized protein LOC107608516 [Arachis ipaensis]